MCHLILLELLWNLLLYVRLQDPTIYSQSIIFMVQLIVWHSYLPLYSIYKRLSWPVNPRNRNVTWPFWMLGRPLIQYGTKVFFTNSTSTHGLTNDLWFLLNYWYSHLSSSVRWNFIYSDNSLFFKEFVGVPFFLHYFS